MRNALKMFTQKQCVRSKWELGRALEITVNVSLYSCCETDAPCT